ncbi:uncharacterized protein LOC143899397 isoform X2 [Temnothorax americanus]|uniref:uncharacterized protein LOC143899397 isoform X2 n=1 Tax=Temnothorax americanus TaxID=1964332 RepID=UPI00406931AA
MNHIIVKDENSTVKLPTQNCRVRFKSVKTYFPEASGLVYYDSDNEQCGLELINDEFQLIPGKIEYRIFYANLSKHPNFKNEGKKKRFQEIMAIIDGEGNNSSGTNFFEKKVGVNKNVKRIIHIGWKHKIDERNKFIHIKEPIAGAKTIELDQAKKYRLAKVKNMILEAMKTEENSKYFEGSVVDIGNYNGEIYDDFRSCSEENFWDFVQKIRSRNSTLRLYLLTQKKSVPNRKTTENSFLEDKQLSQMSQISLPVNQIKNVFSSKLNDLNIEQNRNKRRNFPSAEECSSKKKILFTTKNSAAISSKIHIITNEIISKENVNKKRNFSSAVELSSKKSIKFTTENRAAASSKIHILTNDFESKENLPNNRQTVHNVHLSIPVIDEKNIHFSEILLGKGAFGTVKRATWLGTDVAVKTIELSTSNKYIIREMNIMDKVRHPNIISIMAVSFSQSQCHIVMEYFDSESLRSVLFHGNSKLKLKLNEKNKSLISYQICKAITFLHESRPAILHKDIKPENILVDRHYTTKVCDLGLSKCDAMPSALHTTIGHNFQGTPLYMAPEILIQYKEATIYSDVWSLACVIVELYSQKNVWTLPLGVGYNLINLRGIVSTLKAPNLSKMPIHLRSLLKECFLHEPEKRPSAHTLLNTFKGTESLE